MHFRWMHHHSKAEEAIFKIAKRNDHQFHIENNDMQETNMLSENSTTSSELQRSLKKNDKPDE
ncbi:hypothetical protein WUBG_10863 [Wuchereria bancrofti]|uniref:Uncharacterized protein n=1 Tax=Wuchereria bancrofti TaxID=6293 RepID=J9E7E3_WUCBA|nr:hypothetical protein WUBG_10863 [Wuchereria bancrofti]